MPPNKLHNAHRLAGIVRFELAKGREHLRSVPDTIWAQMPLKCENLNLFLRRSARPFVSSGCLPPDYLRAREAAECQGDISDYPTKALNFGVSKETPRISVIIPATAQLLLKSYGL